MSSIDVCYSENVAVAATAATSTVAAAAAEFVGIVQVHAVGEQAVAAVVT